MRDDKPRHEVIERIRRLRDRSIDQASSEAEVEASARMAAQLISKYEICESELLEAGRDDLVGEGVYGKGRRSLHPALEYALGGIAKLTQCRSLILRGEISFVGLEADREFALYLLELVQVASERAYKGHWRQRRIYAPSQAYRRSYLRGFGLGVAEKLFEIAKEREAQAAQSTGTDLVVLKEELISSFLDKEYPNLGEAKVRRRKHDISALRSGYQSGQRLNVNRPLDGDVGAASQIEGAANG